MQCLPTMALCNPEVVPRGWLVVLARRFDLKWMAWATSFNCHTWLVHSFSTITPMLNLQMAIYGWYLEQAYILSHYVALGMVWYGAKCWHEMFEQFGNHSENSDQNYTSYSIRPFSYIPYCAILSWVGGCAPLTPQQVGLCQFWYFPLISHCSVWFWRALCNVCPRWPSAIPRWCPGADWLSWLGGSTWSGWPGPRLSTATPDLFIRFLRLLQCWTYRWLYMADISSKHTFFHIMWHLGWFGMGQNADTRCSNNLAIILRPLIKTRHHILSDPFHTYLTVPFCSWWVGAPP